MARPDRPLSPPPADLHDRELLLTAWTAPLCRVHRTTHDPRFFGTTGMNRFDDPVRSFGVLYASADLDGAFSETFSGVSAVSMTALRARMWSTFSTTRPLHLCDLRRHGLARITVTTAPRTADRSPKRA